MRIIIIFLALLGLFAPGALSALPHDLKEYCPEIGEGSSTGEWLKCNYYVEHELGFGALWGDGNGVCEEYLKCYNNPVVLHLLNDQVEIAKVEKKFNNCINACDEQYTPNTGYWNSCAEPCWTYEDSMYALILEGNYTYSMPGSGGGGDAYNCRDDLIITACCPGASSIVSGCGTSAPVASAEICNNLVDDDGDSLVDCADSDCAADPSCAFKVSGSVVTGGNKPLAKVKIALMDRSNSEIVVGYTDDSGAFILDYSANATALGLPAQSVAAYLRVYLEDEDGQFVIVWDSLGANNEYVLATQDFPIPTDQRFDIVLKSGIDLLVEDNKNKMPGTKWDSHWDAGNTYYETKRFFDFVSTKLGYSFDSVFSPPVYIYIYTSETNGAFYSPTRKGTGGVFLSPWNSKHDNAECPENCVWHELFHYTMYNNYGSWPPAGPTDKNHAGFKNSNTADSYLESFAEFWPNILAVELNGDTEHLYAGVWNMELNYVPWAKEGNAEEFALATLYWDMYDSNQDKGESMSVPYKDLWDVFMSKRLDNAKEVYDAFNAKWPEKREEIDKLFVAHGIFKSTYPGNGQYDQGEPYWDKDPDGAGPLKPNGKWDAGETFIDIGTPNDNIGRPHQVYTPGEEIGAASNYNRTTRENKPLDEGSFVRADVTSNGAAVNDAVFKVSYSFSDPSLNYVSYGIVDEETGYAYVEIPPDEYEMTASVTADNYDGGQPVTVTADDYYASKAEGAGVIKSAVISAGGKKADYCNNDGTCQTGESQNCGDCWSASPAGGRPGAPGDSSAMGVILIVAVIGAGAFIFAKKRKPAAKPVKQTAVKSEFCQKCGTAIPPESTFCHSCGKKVKKN